MAGFGPQNNYNFGNLFPQQDPVGSQYQRQSPQQPQGMQQNGYSSLRPAPQVPTTYGKMINSPDEIVANDVPMDGSIALFMMRDLSAIYAKAWNSNGSIDTVRYTPDKTPQQAAQSQDIDMDQFQQEVFQRLDDIKKAVTRKPYYGKSKQGAPKKNQEEG